jgi:hypothetical protein
MGSESIQITPEMVAAGEAVLESACDHAEGLPSYVIVSAAADVYIAMERARSEKEAPHCL